MGTLRATPFAILQYEADKWPMRCRLTDKEIWQTARAGQRACEMLDYLSGLDTAVVSSKL